MIIRIAGTDLETTGFKYDDGDRITEIALDIYDYDTETKVFEPKMKFSTLIDPQRSIPAKIQDITGITPDMCQGKPKWEELAPKIAKVLNSCHLLVAHNIDFDAPFLCAELMRTGQSVSESLESFCTMQSGRWATASGKCPKLTELCWALGVEFDDTVAHRALYDTERMMEAFISGVESGWFKLPDSLTVAKEIAA